MLRDIQNYARIGGPRRERGGRKEPAFGLRYELLEVRELLAASNLLEGFVPTQDQAVNLAGVGPETSPPLDVARTIVPVSVRQMASSDFNIPPYTAGISVDGQGANETGWSGVWRQLGGFADRAHVVSSPALDGHGAVQLFADTSLGTSVDRVWSEIVKTVRVDAYVYITPGAQMRGQVISSVTGEIENRTAGAWQIEATGAISVFDSTKNGYIATGLHALPNEWNKYSLLVDTNSNTYCFAFNDQMFDAGHPLGFMTPLFFVNEVNLQALGTRTSYISSVAVFDTPNDAPTIDTAPTQNISEDAPTQTVTLTGISLATTIAATSSNPALIPNPTVSFTPGASMATLRYTPRAEASGSATIQVTLLNSANQVSTKSFVINVAPVNDPPTLDPISDQILIRAAEPQTVGLSGITPGPANETSRSLSITATSSNPAIVPNPTVQYASPDSTGALLFTPTANALGSATITVTVADSGGTAGEGVATFTRTFVVNVTAGIPSILDDEQALYSGEWSDYPAGYQGSARFTSPGSGSATATYTFAVTPGQYQVYSTWPAFQILASNTPVEIFDGQTPSSAVLLNQQQPPDGQVISDWQSLGAVNVLSNTLRIVVSNRADGIVVADAFKIVGGSSALLSPRMVVSGLGQIIPNHENMPRTLDNTDFGTLASSASNRFYTITNPGSVPLNLGGVVISGANASDFSLGLMSANFDVLPPYTSTSLEIRFQPSASGLRSAKITIPSGDPVQGDFVFNVQATVPFPKITLIDDGGVGFSATGSWSETDGAGYLDGYHLLPAGAGHGVATFAFSGLFRYAQYQIYATWTPSSLATGSVPYSIYDNARSISTVQVDQSVAPAGGPYNGSNFQLLGTFDLANSFGSVTIGDADPNHLVVADAIAIYGPFFSGTPLPLSLGGANVTLPKSRVSDLLPSTSLASFAVNWSGSAGSGGDVSSYDVWVSMDGGQFTPWLTGVSATSAQFTAQLGHTYGFVSQAHDAAGYVEPRRATADTTITTTAAPWQNAANPLDVSDNGGSVTPLDALLVINFLNTHPIAALPSTHFAGSSFLDVLGRGTIMALDALAIINYLNAQPAAASTSSPAAMRLSPTAERSLGENLVVADAPTAIATAPSIAAAELSVQLPQSHDLPASPSVAPNNAFSDQGNSVSAPRSAAFALAAAVQTNFSRPSTAAAASQSFPGAERKRVADEVLSDPLSDWSSNWNLDLGFGI